MALVDWRALPSDVVVEIFSKLPHQDRLSASVVCKSWRKCLFDASLWHDYLLKVSIYSNEERLKAKYLTETCGKYVRRADINFQSSIPANVEVALYILEVLCVNPNVQYVKLCPASGRLEHQQRSVINRYVDALKALIKCSRKLKGIAFGCIEEIVDNAEEFLSKLCEYHSNTIHYLYLASVKENPENYKILDISPRAFSRFCNLQRLSVDYDYLSSELLENLARANHVPLIRIDIHLHGVWHCRTSIPDSIWQRLCEHSPKLEICLTLLHSRTGVGLLMNILQPSMRLVRYSQYFCSNINVPAINFIAETFARSFQSIVIVDSMEKFQPALYRAPREDPFVMLAWRCENLTDFTLIGYNIAISDLIAVARLRGRQLKQLKVPECCIEYQEEGNLSNDQLDQEVSNWLEQPWSPILDEDLHRALINWQIDAVGVYLPTIFAEQTW